MSFGEKLTKLRKERGLSQEDLASKLNVSRQAVSKWESNSAYPETEKIVAICKLFNTSFDELIGIKESTTKEKENKFLNKVNYYSDFFINGIKMFYSMTFKQKIKCLVEMAFYAFIILVFFGLIGMVLSEGFYFLFQFLPYNIVSSLNDIFIGLLLLVFLIIGIYLLAKLYKVRYLDYYVLDIDNQKDNEKINLVADEKINLKSEKIIIRDASPNVNPFIWLKKLLLLFCKGIVVFILVPLAISFVFVLAGIIFLLYYINKGAILVYSLFIALGCLLILYIFLEIFIKFIFSIKLNLKRLFIMFITSLIVIGVSGGVFLRELSTYKIIEDNVYTEKVKDINIPMSDNLILENLEYYNAEIIFEERDDIYLEFYATNKDYMDIYEHTDYVGDYRYEYFWARYFSNKSMNEMINDILDYIAKKEIIVSEYDYLVKIHIAKDNYITLKNNHELLDY